MIRAGVVGAAGYAGIEAVRTLLGHPSFELVRATSDSDADKRLCDVYPALAGSTDLCFSPCDAADLAASCDAVFLGVPHTASLALTPALLDAGVAVFDLSADYRLRDAAVYEHWYNTAHTSSQLLEGAVYGLPELYRASLVALGAAQVRLVACAGCYPTASALAALPLLEAGINTTDTVISDCYSGLSGAGRKLVATSAFVSAAEDACAYSVASHRHTPEIAQTLTQAAGHAIQVIFTPHLAPMKRGILATVYLPVQEHLSVNDLWEFYTARYETEPFVHVLPVKAQPRTASVTGTNNAQIGVGLDAATHTAIITCAIDNLDKGAATQAVQCANIVFGLPEDEGLRHMLAPVV